MPGEATVVVTVWLVSSLGVWLLIVNRRRVAVWSLLGATGLFVCVSAVVAAQPIPRWVADSGSRLVRDWYSLFDVSEANEYVALLVLFIHPFLIVALVALAWRKGRRWALVLLPFGYAPLALAYGGMWASTNPGGMEGLAAGLGGFVVGVVAYLIALTVSIVAASVGRLPPRPARSGPNRVLGDTVWRVGLMGAGFVVALMAVVFAIGSDNDSQDRVFVPYPGLTGRVEVRGVDTDGSVWVTVYPYKGDPPGAYPEVGCYVDGAWKTWSVPDAFGAQRVETFAFGTDGAVWMATYEWVGGGARGLGVWRFHDGDWRHYGASDGVSSDRVMHFVTFEDGCVWAQGDAISVFCDGSWRDLTPPRIPHVTDLAVASDGSVWALGYSPGPSGSYWVAQFANDTWTNHTDVQASGTVYASLRVASSGDVWVTFQFPHEDDAVEYWRHDSTGWTHWEASDTPPPEFDFVRSDPAMPYGVAATFGGVRWESGRNGIYRTALGASPTPANGFVATMAVPSTTQTSTTNNTTTTSSTLAPMSTTIAPPTWTILPRFYVGMDGTHMPQWPEDGELFGSGCTPGAGELPDGVWFGWIETYSDTKVAFDLACLYASGAQVRMGNDSSKLRYLEVTDDTTVWALGDQGLGWNQTPYGAREGPSSGCPTGDPPYGDGCFWWLYVNDGIVTEMLEGTFRR